MAKMEKTNNTNCQKVFGVSRTFLSCGGYVCLSIPLEATIEAKHPHTLGIAIPFPGKQHSIELHS